MNNTEKKLNFIPITLLNDNEWEDYFYFGKSKNDENINLDEIQKFKKDRLEQNKNAPNWVKVEEYLLKYDNESIGWLAYFASENCSFIFDTNFTDFPDMILKLLLKKIHDILLNGNMEFAYFWSKNAITSNKLEALGAELLENPESDTTETQFCLTRTFLKNI